MMTLMGDIIETLRTNWTAPRQGFHNGEPSPFSLCCEFDWPASAEQVEQIGASLPESLRQFWLHAQSAVLFKDADYGQWGLRVLSPSDSVQATKDYHESRQRDALNGDQVIGEFLGDSDLVLVRCDSAAADFGSVLVALSMDSRSDWDRVGDDFEDFLQRYVKSDGDKFWEKR
jgi:hypothetical protein